MIGVKSISIIGYDYFTTQELLDDPEFKEFMGDIKINEDSSYLEIEEIYFFTGPLTQIVLLCQNPNLCKLGKTLCAVDINFFSLDTTFLTK